MSTSLEQAQMQIMATTRGKLRGGRKPTRGRNPVVAAARQLARVTEGESSAAAGQPILVLHEEGTVGDGKLAEAKGGEERIEGSSSVARLQIVSFWNFFKGILDTNHMTGPST